MKAGGKLRLRIELQNPAPYALYVHEAGTAPSKTIVNTYVKPLVQGEAKVKIGRDGLPMFARFAKHFVEKKCGAWIKGK